MAIIECPQCKNPVSDEEKKCPNCGCNIEVTAAAGSSVPPLEAADNFGAPPTVNPAAQPMAHFASTETPAFVTSPAETHLNPKKKVKTGLILGITAAAVVALTIIIVAVILLTKNPRAYKKAQDLYDAGEYSQALEMFEELGDYKDSEELATECKYSEGVSLILSGNYKSAETIFSKLDDDYKDTAMYLDRITWEKAIDQLLDPTEAWVKIGGDRSYFQLDSNPDNIDKDDFGLEEYYMISNVTEKIPEINRALGFSDAVMEKMNKTTAMQGVQREDTGRFSVQWSYHPDNGLEVTYEFRLS